MASKSNFGINSKQRDKFIFYFTEAMNLFTPELQLKGENIQKEVELVYILGGMLNVSDEPISFGLIRGIIERGVRKCKRDNITDPEQIVEVLRKIYQKRKTRPTKQFTIVASLHLEKNVIPKKSGNFFNSPFSVYGYNRLFKKYKVKRYINPSFEKIKTMRSFRMLSPTEKEDMKKSNYIEVKIESEDKDSAFQKAWQIIELFRAIINYSASFGTYRLLGQHNPFSIVLPSTYIFVFDKNHDLASYWYTRSLHEKDMKMIDAKKIEKIKNGFFCG